MLPAIVTRNAMECALLFNLKQSGKWSAGSERDDGNNCEVAPGTERRPGTRHPSRP